MAMTAMSILICVIVLNLHHRDPSAPVPRWLSRLTLNMSSLVCMRDQVRQKGVTVYQLCELSQNHATSHAHENNVGGEPQSPFFEDLGGSERMNYGTSGSGKKQILLEEILKHLRQITDKLKEKEEQGSLKAEWKEVAKIMDRFFLLVFVLLVVVSSLVLLLVYPLSSRRLHI